MYALMPGIAAILGRSRSTTSSALAVRSPLGLRRNHTLPVLSEPPKPPADEVKVATSGSAWITAATAFWCLTMASNDMPCAASVVPKSMPMSCEGMNPLGMRANRTPVRTVTVAVTPIIVRRWPSDHRRPFSYARSMAANARSERLYNRWCATSAGGRRKRLASIGVSVSDTKPEISTASPMTTANSRNNRPTMPPMNSTGMKTAASESVIETIVKPISCAPSRAASSGGLPISMWRTMFSSMTMASSTTNPTDRVSAISDRLSTE